MIRIFVISVYCILCVQDISSQSIRFQKQYFNHGAGNVEQGINFYEMAALRDGGFATLGFSTEAANRTAGLLSRFDCLGNVVWSLHLGISGSPTNTRFGIIEAENGDIVYSFNQATGFFQGTNITGRVTQDGVIIWTKRIGVRAEFGHDLVETKDGGVVIAGGTIQYGSDAGAFDVYLVKLDASGNIVWTKTFGNPGTTYDEGFAIEEDSRGNLVVTGRCINRGTFMAFIIKTDASGKVLHSKVFGAENQGTQAYDLALTKEDEIVITGFTTIIEFNFQERADMFLIKTDTALNPLITNVYDPIVGTDWGSLGEGIVALDDGSYAIITETGSFTTHNLPGAQAAGKWALFHLLPNGDISKVLLYNLKGSQYPRIRKSFDEGFIMSGFSTQFLQINGFPGLIVKTDDNFNSNCGEIDVSDEVAVLKPNWIIEDFKFVEKSGGSALNYTNVRLDTSMKTHIICEEYPKFQANFEGPDSICVGQEIILKNTSTGAVGNIEVVWDIDGEMIMGNIKELKYRFLSPGIKIIRQTVSFKCITSTYSDTIVVGDFTRGILEVIRCPGDVFVYKGTTYVESQIIQDTTIGSDSCNTLLTINLLIKKAEKVESVTDTFCGNQVILFDSIFTSGGIFPISIKDQSGCDSVIFDLILTKQECDCIKFPNSFTPDNGDDINNDFKPFLDTYCEENVLNYQLIIFNRWGQKVFESDDPKKSWDGKFKGQAAPMETYLYYSEYGIRLDAQSVKNFTKKGDVSLIR
ncbi:MAG: gliding motility-associated C-terminal domain-containing protein [Bacteroidota bacterium]|nr:gliding motility-associated C-terminal domain-containing protein [Bacteroidota bacterium]